jgi:hypothetical protein
MKISKFLIGIIICFLLGSWVAVGCNPVRQIATPTATLIPTFTPTRSSTPTLFPALEATPTKPNIPDTGWILLQPGLERRKINIHNDQDQWVESLYILRLDQNHFRLDVAYHETPQTLENWQTETHALIVVNGGYFREENDKYIPTGLIIVDRETIGSSYGAFAGMLAITGSGAKLRWLANKPYDPNESLLAALQSFPVLVKPGGKLGFPEQYEDNLQARRTVIGQDQDGRMLLMVADQGYFTLHQLSVYLTESDLNLNIAINLDGGPSSGILLADPQEIIPAQSLLPLVITVYVR